LVGVGVLEGVAVCDDVCDGVALSEAVVLGLGVGESDGVLDCDLVGDLLGVCVGVALAEAVMDGVGVDVSVGDELDVGVGVDDGVALAHTAPDVAPWLAFRGLAP